MEIKRPSQARTKAKGKTLTIVLLTIILALSARTTMVRAAAAPDWTTWTGVYYTHDMMLVINPTGWVDFERICSSCFAGYSSVDGFRLTSANLASLDDQLHSVGYPKLIAYAATNNDAADAPLIYFIGNGVILLYDPDYVDGAPAFCSASTDVRLLPQPLADQNVCAV